MNLKTIFKFTFILLTAVWLTGCKEEVELEVPEGDRKVFIESEITTETDSSFVRIRQTIGFYSTDPYPEITNATVEVNGVPFLHKGNGLYKPASPYTGVAGQSYDLKIVHDGKTYTSSTKIEPMFTVDSLFQTFKPKEGFLDAGWAVNYKGIDNRSRIKYTYFRIGYFDTVVHRDSFTSDKILFDNAQSPIGTPIYFELPFTRFQPGDECLMIFRSVDKDMYDFILAYSAQNSGAPGPFQVPAANLPYNIKGGAIGYFAGFDVLRKRYTIK